LFIREKALFGLIELRHLAQHPVALPTLITQVGQRELYRDVAVWELTRGDPLVDIVQQLLIDRDGDLRRSHLLLTLARATDAAPTCDPASKR